MSVVVRSVSWLSEYEATLTVSDGTHSYVVFAHPYTGVVGDELHEPLLGFNVDKIIAVNGVAHIVSSVDDGYVQELVGQVVDWAKPLIRVGDILVEPDLPLPCDITEGDTVQFAVKRLDYMG